VTCPCVDPKQCAHGDHHNRDEEQDDTTHVRNFCDQRRATCRLIGARERQTLDVRSARERRTLRWGRSGRRRYGVIHRPGGRHRPTDWVNDGGRDLPLTRADLRIILTWTAGLLALAIVIAAIWTLVT
jgi:hypothetical protein